MLKFPQLYTEQLNVAAAHIKENEKDYKFMHVTPYWTNDILYTAEDEVHYIVRLSVAENKVLGYFRASVDRVTNNVTSLVVVNFNLKTVSFTFVKDLKAFVDYLFGFCGFRKINFSVIVGNPAERLYDAFVERFGGRIVGVWKDDVKLVDGKMYDLKQYEVYNPAQSEKTV